MLNGRLLGWRIPGLGLRASCLRPKSLGGLAGYPIVLDVREPVVRHSDTKKRAGKNCREKKSFSRLHGLVDVIQNRPFCCFIHDVLEVGADFDRRDFAADINCAFLREASLQRCPLGGGVSFCLLVVTRSASRQRLCIPGRWDPRIAGSCSE